MMVYTNVVIQTDLEIKFEVMDKIPNLTYWEHDWL